ncbi:hypothetical protein C5167_036743 [Papaver somniferum]|uniref:Uncharacterized protein n=1 Tax=Papaver somniferum TaxID=3469 RepID=A0A4Y7I829_PAPSO|nr:hypothetical protein C5167_036743 [Papaver somniferum]
MLVIGTVGQGEEHILRNKEFSFYLFISLNKNSTKR